MGTLEFSHSTVQCTTFYIYAIFRAPKKSCHISSYAKQEKVPNHTVSTLWELVMFQVSLRRLFRNELCTKNTGSPEMLKRNKVLEFGVP